MVKSKFQIKAQDNISKKSENPKGRPRYYDEDISTRPKSNMGYAVFIVIVVFAAVAFAGNSIYQTNRAADALAAKELLDPGYVYSGGDSGTSYETTTGIKVGDSVELEYTLYIAPKGSGNPGLVDTTSAYQGPSTFTTDVIKGKLINGFFYQIIGMVEGQTKEFNVGANVDANEDGFDDITTQEVLSYGAPSHELYNTNLFFRVKLIKIN